MLVDYGFRLPSALDNRPLTFDEFERTVHQAVYVSATPGPYEYEHSTRVVEQIIRPTGLLDPTIEVRPSKGQIDVLVEAIRARVANKQRVLVTTLTKKMSEDLAEYLREMGIKVHYLHSEMDVMERVEVLRDLRLGTYDVVVGINLLREGLDLPEVSLIGDPGRRQGGLSALRDLADPDHWPRRPPHRRPCDHVRRRRDRIRCAGRSTRPTVDVALQIAYNEAHGIVPISITKGIRDLGDRVRAVAETPGRLHRGRRIAEGGGAAAAEGSGDADASRLPANWSSSAPPSCATRSPRCASGSARRVVGVPDIPTRYRGRCPW